MHVDVADMVTLLPIPADFLWSLYVQLRLAQVRLFRLKTIDVVLQAVYILDCHWFCHGVT